MLNLCDWQFSRDLASCLIQIQSDRRQINGDVGGGGGGGYYGGGGESRRSPGEPYAVARNKPPNALTQV